MSGPQHAPRDPEVRADLEEVVRQDRQLSPHPHEQRSDRVDQQPHQADQTHRLWLSELRELPDQSLALRGQAELASPRLDCGVMNVTPPECDDPVYNEKMVGRAGLEPATPCVSCKCATRLRQRPLRETTLPLTQFSA